MVFALFRVGIWQDGGWTETQFIQPSLVSSIVLVLARLGTEITGPWEWIPLRHVNKVLHNKKSAVINTCMKVTM